MNSGAFLPAFVAHEIRPTTEEVERARIDAATRERIRQARVYGVVLAALRVVGDDIRALGQRSSSPELQRDADRIAGTVEGAMESMRSMRPIT